MSNLRQRMAENGFESNENYDYILKCLQNQPFTSIPCLNIQGDCGRKKTAFANALALSTDTQQTLYHDFSQEDPAKNFMPKTTVTNDEEGKEEPPIQAFDRVLSDACAFSEAESTILILDQLHAADFKDHIRIYQFLITQEWRYKDANFYANQKNLTVYLISEAPIYHSLQKQSFRVWVDIKSRLSLDFKAEDFGLENQADALIDAFSDLFKQLQCSPTFSEYAKILHDAEHNILSIDDLKRSLFGWVENLDQQALAHNEHQSALHQTLDAIQNYIGIEDEFEITSLEQ